MRTEPQRLINLALSILWRYFTDSLHSFTILLDLAKAKQDVALTTATLLQDLNSFLAKVAPQHRRQSARLRECRSFHCHLQGTPDHQPHRRHSTR